MDLSKVLDKIKKLKTLAKDNASDGEREAAIRTVQELQNKYKIDAAILELENDINPFETTSEVLGHVVLDAWLTRVYMAVAMRFDCHMLIVQHPHISKNLRVSGKNHPEIIGTLENIAIVKEIALVIIKSIKTEAKNYAAGTKADYKNIQYQTDFEAYIREIFGGELPKHGNTPQEKARAYRSFCVGAAQILLFKSHEFKQAKERESQQAMQHKEPGTSLAVINDKLSKQNQDYIDENYAGRVQQQKMRSPREDTVDHRAFNAGVEHGNNIEVTKQPKRIS